jgi:hypothetical protein
MLIWHAHLYIFLVWFFSRQKIGSFFNGHLGGEVPHQNFFIHKKGSKSSITSEVQGVGEQREQGF